MGTVSVCICRHRHQCISCLVPSQPYQPTARTLATHCLYQISMLLFIGEVKTVKFCLYQISVAIYHKKLGYCKDRVQCG